MVRLRSIVRSSWHASGLGVVVLATIVIANAFERARDMNLAAAMGITLGVGVNDAGWCVAVMMQGKDGSGKIGWR